MKIHAVLVCKNEEHRYLKAFLEWNSRWWDTLFVYDDQSEDNSFDIAMDYASAGAIRHEDVPPFSEHEGLFRQASWDIFEVAIQPEEEDWVFCIDADEFVTSHNPKKDLEWLTRRGHDSVLIPIPEVWEIKDNTPLIRTDLYWAGNAGPRFFRYKPGGQFRTKRAMGCGTSPIYAEKNPLEQEDVSILHFGYANAEDKEEKYARYLGVAGHGRSHIHSIRSKRPVLEPWNGDAVKWQV